MTKPSDIDEIEKRIDNAIEFNWTGGFEKKFLLEHIETLLYQRDIAIQTDIEEAIGEDLNWSKKEKLQFSTDLGQATMYMLWYNQRNAEIRAKLKEGGYLK